MDREYFLNAAGIQPPLHFEQPQMPTWQSLSSAPEMNCSPDQSSDCFRNLNWDKANFESALSSMVSSPAASNSAVSNGSFAIRELIGKLGNICNSGDLSPGPHPLLAATVAYIGGGNNSTNTSCYSTPLNSPPKLNLGIMDNFVKENLPNLGKSLTVNPNLPALSAADPGFAERAAKFSCFGSRSFSGRTSQLGLNNDTELPYRSSPLTGSTKLPRVASTPSLKGDGSPPMAAQENAQMEMRYPNGSADPKFSRVPVPSSSDRAEFGCSNEESSVSEQIPNRETELKTPTGSASRKRKAVSRGKSKEIITTQSANVTKVAESEDDPSTKRSKSSEGNGGKNGSVNTEEKTKGTTANGASDEGQKQSSKANPKPPEPPKDYIHVRARRGQATDSHSLAERVRREKISERMKLLQDLVPGCNKVTGKALMLDEIINYVQSLQRQVEFLSMKLATVNPRLDVNLDSLLSKDVFQPNGSLPSSLYPMNSSVSPFLGHQTQEIPQAQTNIFNGAVTHCSVDPLDTTLCRNPSMELPLVDEFGQGLQEFPTLCEDDLQSIVQMGFGQNPNQNPEFHSQSFPGSSQTSNMKIEL